MKDGGLLRGGVPCSQDSRPEGMSLGRMALEFVHRSLRTHHFTSTLPAPAAGAPNSGSAPAIAGPQYQIVPAVAIVAETPKATNFHVAKKRRRKEEKVSGPIMPTSWTAPAKA